jgi:lysophospholipase L1-like esterase
MHFLWLHSAISEAYFPRGKTAFTTTPDARRLFMYRTVSAACLVLALAKPVVAQVPAPPSSSTVPTQVATPISAEERAARIKAHQEQMLNDWANLNRYRDADATIGTPPLVVFMGDSITELWGQNSALFFPGKPYLSRGIGGQTTPQMVLRFHQDVVDLNPRVVVINGGTNDIAGNTGPSNIKMIEDNLKSMTEMAEANHIQVVLTSITPAFDYPWRKGLEPAEKIVALNTWIQDFCKKSGCIYADYFTPLANDKHGMRDGMSVDGVHPTPAGYRIMMPITEQAITQALEH